MKNSQKLRTVNEQCIIYFPEKINTITFEALLKEKYSSSKKHDVIIFNFSYVKWCNIFELSLISLWIKELSEKLNRKIVFIEPTNIEVKYFLLQYEFNKILLNNNVENTLEETIIRTGVNELLSAPYFPLKFYHESGFYEFYKFLSDENNYNTIFNDLINTSIGNSQYLRNIIIKEIGENMYKHANGQYSNIIMSKYGKGVTDKTIRLTRQEAAIANSIGNEKIFFQDLAGRDYFTIVISDKGPGIFKKLFELGWQKDETVNNNDSPKEVEIIKYAFREYSTSRTKEERYGSLSELFDNKLYEHSAPILSGPTGLYQVLNIVKQNHGFIYVRSGSSIVSYNFYGNSKEGTVSQFDKLKKIGKLSNFGGTQIKIHFPYDLSLAQQLEKNNQKYFPIQKKFKSPESDEISTYKYISIIEYDINDLQESSIQKAEILKFQEFVKNYKFTNKNSHSGIILDLYNQENISSKVIYFFVCTLIDSQEENYSHVLVNLSPILTTALKAAFRHKSDAITNYKPITLFDTNYDRNIIGVSEDEERLFNDLFFKDKFEEKEDLDFIQKHDHLFYVNNAVGFKHNRSIIFEKVMIGINSIIVTHTLNPENSIYNPNVKVLMPTGYYCEGYFQIFNLVENKFLRNLIKQRISYFLVRYKPNVIVSVSQNCNKIIDELYLDFNIRERPLESLHYKIKSPLSVDPALLFDLSNKIQENHKVLIFTDVIATHKTIIQILKRITNASQLVLITIVNASPDPNENLIVNEKQISLRQLVKKSLKFFLEKPVSWINEAIINVDVATNNLILKKCEIKRGIWSEFRNEDFIAEYIIKDKNFLIGHYEHDKTHLPILFDIPNICKKYSDVIAQVILGHFKTLFDFTNVDSKVNNKILYLSDKSELSDVAAIIATSIFFSIEQINSKEITSINDYEGNEYLNSSLIFIDDAIDTGENIFKVIDYSNRKNARNLFVYTIIKRGSDYHTRRITHIKKYGGMNIFFNYLIDINIPTYNINQCPICKRKTELEILVGKIEGYIELSKLTEFIKEYTQSLRERKFIDFKKNKQFYSDTLGVSSHEDFEFRLEIEKAKNNFELREIFLSYFNEFERNLTKIKRLIPLIAREQLYFLFDSKYENDERTFIFKQNVVLACKNLAKNPLLLNTNEYDGILSVLRYLNEEAFIDKLYSYISKAIRNERHLSILLMHIFLSKQSNILINSISHSFNKVIIEQSKKDSKNLSLLKQILVWWVQNKIRKQDRTLIVFEDLKNINHEVVRFITSIKGYINSPKKKEIQSIIYNFGFLQNTIVKKMFGDLRELIEFDFFNKDIITRVEKMINKLDDTFDYFNNAKIQYDRSQEEISFINSITTIIQQIETIIYDDPQTSLSETLDMCITNITDLLNHILINHQAELLKSGITCNKLTSETPIIVFGDEPGIFSIFDNIIENIILHSKATKLFFDLEFDKVKNEVNIYVVDNGILPTNFEEGYGIINIRRNTTRYSNKPYELKRIGKKDVKFYDQFKTVNYVNLKQIV